MLKLIDNHFPEHAIFARQFRIVLRHRSGVHELVGRRLQLRAQSGNLLAIRLIFLFTAVEFVTHRGNLLAQRHRFLNGRFLVRRQRRHLGVGLVQLPLESLVFIQ